MPIRVSTIRDKTGTSTTTVDVPDPETGTTESMEVTYRPWEITPAFWDMIMVEALPIIIESWDLVDDEHGTFTGTPKSAILPTKDNIARLPSSFLRLIVRKIREDNALGELSASS